MLQIAMSKARASFRASGLFAFRTRRSMRSIMSTRIPLRSLSSDCSNPRNSRQTLSGTSPAKMRSHRSASLRAPSLWSRDLQPAWAELCLSGHALE